MSAHIETAALGPELSFAPGANIPRCKWNGLSPRSIRECLQILLLQSVAICRAPWRYGAYRTRRRPVYNAMVTLKAFFVKPRQRLLGRYEDVAWTGRARLTTAIPTPPLQSRLRKVPPSLYCHSFDLHLSLG